LSESRRDEAPKRGGLLTGNGRLARTADASPAAERGISLHGHSRIAAPQRSFDNRDAERRRTATNSAAVGGENGEVFSPAASLKRAVKPGHLVPRGTGCGVLERANVPRSRGP